MSLSSRTTRWYLDPTAWTAALAISGYPIAGLLSTYLGIVDDGISIAFRVFVVAMAMVAFWRGHAIAPLRTVDPWLVAFWVVYSGRLLWDAYVIGMQDAETATLFFAVTVVVPVIALALTATSWNERNVALCFMTVGTVVSASGIWLSKSGVVDISYFEETGRLGFDKINPISLGHVGCTTVLASIVLFFRSNSRLLRGTTLACGCIALAMIYIAASRGPIVSLMATIIVYVLAHRKWKYSWVGFVVLFSSITVIWVIDVNPILENFRFTTVGVDATSVERFQNYEEALEVFAQHPLFGNSFNLPVSGGWVHNIFLEAAMATGVAGLTILVVLCTRSFVSSVKVLREGDVRTGDFMRAFLFLQFVVAAQFSGALWAWPGLWMGVALVNARRRRVPRSSRIADSAFRYSW